MNDFVIDVVGLPVPKGSKSAFIVGRGTPKARATVTDISNKSAKDRLNVWKLAVTAAMQREMERHGNRLPTEVPLEVSMHFFLPKPASASKKVVLPAKKPDWDKLARTVGDILSKVVYKDDSQIVDAIVSKRFAMSRPPGVLITVRPASHENLV